MAMNEMTLILTLGGFLTLVFLAAQHILDSVDMGEPLRDRSQTQTHRSLFRFWSAPSQDEPFLRTRSTGQIVAAWFYLLYVVALCMVLVFAPDHPTMEGDGIALLAHSAQLLLAGSVMFVPYAVNYLFRSITRPYDL